jgi:2-amino-4-hydroxy-6-hydroxymethyldihydropteridine diphosphokinase
MKIGIALGSNLGDRMANLRAARKELIDLVGNGGILVSPVYETEPVNCEPGADKFLNAVLEIEYDGDPTDLLEHLIRVEESLGRKRDHENPPSPGSGVAGNISRKIDIDLLYADELKVENERLQLPHPRMHLRRFVLQPLSDIRPDFVLVGPGKTVRETLAKLQDSTKVVCFAENW